MIFVKSFTVPIYISLIHQLFTPEHILMGFHQLKKLSIIKQTCHRNSPLLPVERYRSHSFPVECSTNYWPWKSSI